MRDPRATFAHTAAQLVDEDLSVALVYAEISGQYFGDVATTVTYSGLSRPGAYRDWSPPAPPSSCRPPASSTSPPTASACWCGRGGRAGRRLGARGPRAPGARWDGAGPRPGRCAQPSPDPGEGPGPPRDRAGCRATAHAPLLAPGDRARNRCAPYLRSRSARASASAGASWATTASGSPVICRHVSRRTAMPPANRYASFRR